MKLLFTIIYFVFNFCLINSIINAQGEDNMAFEILKTDLDCVNYIEDIAKNNYRRHFEIIMSLYKENLSVQEVCNRFNCSRSLVYEIVSKFVADVKRGDEPFFKTQILESKPAESGKIDNNESLVIDLRKKNLSVPEIQITTDAMGLNLSTHFIRKVLEKNGFTKMKRRDSESRQTDLNNIIKNFSAPKSELCKFEPERFSSANSGILIFLPIIKKYRIDELINSLDFPGTCQVPKLNSILSFVALKLSNIERYSNDDIWCMDRGMGLFAGLNVLPKKAWYSSYSNRVTREVNSKLLKGLNDIWLEAGLLSGTFNLDFTTMPYWGSEESFENNWSGKRSKALPSILAAICHDPQSGIICYGDTTIKHENSNQVILQFLDFYSEDPSKKVDYLVFDSKFTTYQQLGKLDMLGIKFITIQRKGKKLNAEIEAIDKTQWKKIIIEKANNKHRSVFYHDKKDTLLYTYSGKDKNHSIRQIFIKNNEDKDPAILITNDFKTSPAEIIRKYALRWLVEKEISEQIHFFHLNSLSSSIVIKVDFDLTMSILSHNLYRLFALEFPSYKNCFPRKLYTNLINNSGIINITKHNINVSFNKKRSSPVLAESTFFNVKNNYQWLNNLQIDFSISSST
jgi:transposase